MAHSITTTFWDFSLFLTDWVTMCPFCSPIWWLKNDTLHPKNCIFMTEWVHRNILNNGLEMTRWAWLKVGLNTALSAINSNLSCHKFLGGCAESWFHNVTREQTGLCGFQQQAYCKFPNMFYILMKGTQRPWCVKTKGRSEFIPHFTHGRNSRECFGRF